MKDIGETSETEKAHGPLTLAAEVDYARLRPCSDEVFEAYRGLYAYTKTPLEARLESREDWSEDTVLERVSFADAEGSDRVIVYIFLPRKVPPPWQGIVYFPGGAANVLHSLLEYARSVEVELFTGSGRAFVFPVFWSTFERRLENQPARTRQFLKDRMIRHHREIGRTLDYLETRPDFDHDRIAYQGLSWGAWFGPLHVALEKRFKAANFQGGGFNWESYASERGSPEWDAANFASRVTVPVLMQNGAFDAYFELETNVRPFFRLLGTPEKDKHLVVYPTGHAVWMRNEYRKAMFDFFDRYLGPARRAP